MDIEPAAELSLLDFPELLVETPPARDRVAEIILHSEAVVQILGVPPRWLARWGATVMVGVVGFLIGLAWLIHYPEVYRKRCHHHPRPAGNGCRTRQWTSGNSDRPRWRHCPERCCAGAHPQLG